MENNNYIKTTTEAELIEFFKDYIENYESIEDLARDYVLSVDETKELINTAEKIVKGK